MKATSTPHGEQENRNPRKTGKITAGEGQNERKAKERKGKQRKGEESTAGRKTDRLQTAGEIHGEVGKQADRRTCGHADMRTCGQARRQTYHHTDIQAYRYTEMQIQDKRTAQRCTHDVKPQIDKNTGKRRQCKERGAEPVLVRRPLTVEPGALDWMI